MGESGGVLKARGALAQGQQGPHHWAVPSTHLPKAALPPGSPDFAAESAQHKNAF